MREDDLQDRTDYQIGAVASESEHIVLMKQLCILLIYRLADCII